MTTRWDSLTVNGEAMRCHVAAPEGEGPFPAVVVIQHAGGVDAFVQEMAGRPVLVFLHHPPIMTGIRCMDEIALEASSAARLGAIVAREPRIERIVCGHVHRGIQARWHGTVVSICPSTAFQGVLNLRGDTFDAATDEPPMYQVHYWNGDELVTHTVAVSLRA